MDLFPISTGPRTDGGFTTTRSNFSSSVKSKYYQMNYNAPYSDKNCHLVKEKVKNMLLMVQINKYNKITIHSRLPMEHYRKNVSLFM